MHPLEGSMIEDQAKQLLLDFRGLDEGDIVAYLDTTDWAVSHDDYHPPKLIPKRNGGKRKILEPKAYLKDAHQKVVRYLVSCGYGPSPFAHGFVNQRGRRTNALPHIGHTRMLKIDIENFFGACSPELVLPALERLDPPDWLVKLISRICFLDGGLPQGAPTSPMLSNIVARQMDYRLAGLCTTFMRRPRPNMAGHYEKPRVDPIAYTRYADDMTFTSIWDGLQQLVHPVSHILNDCGFTVKTKKTKYFTSPARLESCGVVVSKEKINARRRDRMYWRGRLHKMVVDIKSNGVQRGHFVREDKTVGRISGRMLRRIRGKIAAIVDISPQDRENLFSKFTELQKLCVLESS
jgi:RNA-directed DNA polymerase